MKKAGALYLSAREASAELAISPATLYAYVSRGLIRSERWIPEAIVIGRRTFAASRNGARRRRSRAVCVTLTPICR